MEPGPSGRDWAQHVAPTSAVDETSLHSDMAFEKPLTYNFSLYRAVIILEDART